MTRQPFPIVAAVALLGLAPTMATAQAIAVRTIDGATALPIAGAVVTVSDATGAVLARSLTDARGRALLFRIGEGLRRVHAEMIGMTTAETELFEVRAGGPLDVELALRSAPLLLEGLSVAAEQRCRTAATDGLATARLWDEARKALTAAAVTDEQQTYRYLTMRYEQDLDRETRRVRRSRETRREADMRTPFRSRPVDELAAEGYVDRSGPLDIYFAPDAHVLLSDAFLDTHCFRVAFGGESGETAGLMGLAFEPVSTRGAQVDVAGTLWLDPASSELRFLEYRYVNLGPDVRDDALGGRVAFERMPEGGWIVREWWIRMPRMSRQWDLRGEETITYLSGYREAGGLVLDVQGAGLALGHSLTGAMEGLVQDSTGRPVRGSRVRLVGTEHVAFTDSTGFFRFADLVQGVYDLEVSEAVLERVGYPPTTRTRAVVNGESTLVDVSLPSVRAHLVATCIAEEPLPEWLELARDYPSEGILYGWVVDDATGVSVSEALVSVLTPTVDFRPGRERADAGQRQGVNLGGVNTAETGVIVRQGAIGVAVTTDGRGFFRVCNLPERHPIVVRAELGGIETPEVRLMVDEAGGVLEQVIRIGARRKVRR